MTDFTHLQNAPNREILHLNNEFEQNQTKIATANRSQSNIQSYIHTFIFSGIDVKFLKIGRHHF